jgi:soluble lytic murein transglycosylase-like protein
MSFLNGIGALGTGLGALASNVAKDEEDRARTPLLNATPAAPAASTPAAADPIVAANPPPAGSAVAGVPADLIPIYAAASKRTGIPIDVLIAQGKQESGFRSDIIGNAGEIGIHQVKPSTGRDPGFGMRGIDPATLRDPTVNINFAADYLKARAGEAANLSNPADIDRALAAYNGGGPGRVGGDPNYVANVRRYMGAPASVAPAAARLTDQQWLDEQAKTYPGLGGV